MKTEIPKIIHFIWAGGLKPMPKLAVDVAIEWIKNNPDFDIWIWTDQETFGKNDIQETYKKLFDKKHKFNIKDIRKDLFCATDSCEFLGEHKNYLKNLILYEIEKPNPNYGASSDLLRYAILSVYGGAYFDVTDVAPGELSLQDSGVFKKYDTHVLYIEHMTQKLTKDCFEELKEFKLDKIGNDAFISTKNNPFFEKFIKKSIARYKDCSYYQSYLKLENENLKKLCFAHTLDSDRMNFTIYTTGPVLVKNCFSNLHFIKKENFFETKINSASIILLPLRNGGKNLSSPRKNTTFWLTDLPEVSDDPILKVKKTIQREFDIFNMVCLDDHYDFLIQQGYLKGKENIIREELQGLLANLLKKRINDETGKKLYLKCLFDLDIQKKFKEQCFNVGNVLEVDAPFILKLIWRESYLDKISKEYNLLMSEDINDLKITINKEEKNAVKRTLVKSFFLMKRGVTFIDRLNKWLISERKDLYEEIWSKENFALIAVPYKKMDEILSDILEEEKINIQTIFNDIEINLNEVEKNNTKCLTQ